MPIFAQVLRSAGRCALVVNDSGSELWGVCEGALAERGPTHRIDWMAPGPGSRFNALSSTVLPPAGLRRDAFLARLAEIILPYRTGDGYFVTQGRNVLGGFAGYLVAAVEARGTDAFAATLPKLLHGREASLPMLAHWLAALSRSEAHGRSVAGHQDALVGDAHGARAGGWPQALMPLVDMAPRERSCVFGMVCEGLAPFLDPTVAERTAASDFSPADLRARDGTVQPMSIFVEAGGPASGRRAVLNALFCEACAQALAQPSTGDAHSWPVYLVLAEFHKLPRMRSVVEVLGSGRGVFGLLGMDSSASLECSYPRLERERLDAARGALLVADATDEGGGHIVTLREHPDMLIRCRAAGGAPTRGI